MTVSSAEARHALTFRDGSVPGDLLVLLLDRHLARVRGRGRGRVLVRVVSGVRVRVGARVGGRPAPPWKVA